MLRTRVTVAGIGVAIGIYGLWLMVRWQTVSQLGEVTAWAVAGVILHDAVLAPVALGAGWLIQRTLPRSMVAPTTIAVVLIGCLTVTVIPVLTRSHDGGANRTLLDRNYPLGWLITVAVIVGGVAVGAALATGVRRWQRRSADGTSHGG